jgi:hypothetical protein
VVFLIMTPCTLVDLEERNVLAPAETIRQAPVIQHSHVGLPTYILSLYYGVSSYTTINIITTQSLLPDFSV